MGILDAPGLAPTAAGRDKIDSAASIALQAAAAGLANRDNAPFRVLCVGDSLTEGSNNTSRDKRWTSRLRDGLRNTYPTTGLGTGGGFGWLPCYFIGTSMGQPYTSLNSGVPSTDNTFGWGRRCAKPSSTATGWRFTITASSFDIGYVRAAATYSFNVSIDGGAATLVTVTGGAVTDGLRWNSGALTAGSHTVDITWVSGTNCYITGLMIYNGDETKGIQVIESGHWGWKSTDWVAGATFWPANIAAQQPQLVLLGLGVNDYQNNVASATVKTNLQAMIAAIRAQCSLSPSFVLLAWHNRGDVPSPAEPWVNYVNAMYSIAASDTGGVGGASGVTVWDGGRRLPAPGATGSGDPLALIDTDHVHLKDKGGALVADSLLGFIRPR